MSLDEPRFINFGMDGLKFPSARTAPSFLPATCQRFLASCSTPSAPPPPLGDAALGVGTYHSTAVDSLYSLYIQHRTAWLTSDLSHDSIGYVRPIIRQHMTCLRYNRTAHDLSELSQDST